MNRKKSKSQPRVEFTFSIGPTGTITAIYDDRLADFFESGQTTIKRVSFVEPVTDFYGELGWTADMSLSNGPVLGPFRLREQALAAERQWLEARLFSK